MCRTSRQGMSGVSCRSRHSRRSRAPTPGGSSRWTRRSASSACSIVASPPKSRTTSWRSSLKIAVLVEVVDDVLGQLADGRLAVEEAELIGQVVVERAGPRGHVLHRFLLAVGLLAERRPGSAAALRRRARSSSRRARSSCRTRWAPAPAAGSAAAGPAVSSPSASVGGDFPQVVQDRILAQLLLDPLLQRHDRQLQDLHRLDHARRHPKAHLGPHLLRGIEPHDPLLPSENDRRRSRQPSLETRSAPAMRTHLLATIMP